MRRLAATLRCDVRIQLRNGFYWAAAVVALYSVALLRLLGPETRAQLLPPVLWSNLLIGTFYFFGGLVLLERREGTLEALVVTPLRVREYLASKLATLAGLALLENLAIVLAGHGPAFRPLPLAAGLVLAAVPYCLFGFAVVARYDSINEYLMPSFVFVLLLSLPLVDYFGVWSSPLFWLHPMQGSLVLMRAAFQPVSGWAQLLGVLSSLLWIVPAFLWSRSAFRRFVVAREGVRR